MVRNSRGDGKKIVLLLLLIVILLIGSILIIDFTSSMFGIYFPIPGLKELRKITLQKKQYEIEDPFLLEREELYKDKERVSLYEEQVITRENEIKLKEKDIKKKLEVLQEFKSELEKKEKTIEEQENQFNDRKKNIREQAEKLYNMPPKDAVALLEKQTESDIVAILRAIDAYSEELGRQSTSPYFMKLMSEINKEKTANVLRKLKYTSGEKDTSVEILEEINEAPPEP